MWSSEHHAPALSANRGRGGRIGTQPVEQVITVENHDAAYHVWRDAGVRRRTLIHIDAHHDMWWIADRAQLTIANFICQALVEDLVGQVWWIVPEGTWTNFRTRRVLFGQLRKLARGYGGDPAAIRMESGRVSTRLLGKPVTVCPLSTLPMIDEDVLLDLDVDRSEENT